MHVDLRGTGEERIEVGQISRFHPRHCFVRLVKSVNIDNGEVRVQLALATNDPNVPATIKTMPKKSYTGSPESKAQKS